MKKLYFLIKLNILLAKKARNFKPRDTSPKFRINHYIKVPQIRLVGDNLDEVSEVAGRKIETDIYSTREVQTWADELGLDVLYEVHTQEDLNKIELDNKIIGINNRNLKTFEVDIEHSLKLAEKIPDSCIKVSESGIDDPKTIKMLKEHGFQGFLIGESFMKTDDPGKACKAFIEKL